MAVSITLKRALWALVVVAILVLIVSSFRPTPVLVDTATVAQRTLRVTADDDGRTRVRERYSISAPLPGRLLRTPLDPGDVVEQGTTVVAEFLPVAPELFDSRTRAEAEARARRAQAAVREAQARRDEAKVRLRFTNSELERAKGLEEKGAESKKILDAAQRDEEQARQSVRASEFAVQIAEYELEMVQASLREPDPADLGVGSEEGSVEDRRMLLHSPITGQVLRVFEESARTLPAGAPILEVGNTGALEIVADYLSQDAVKIQPGMEVLVSGWGGESESGGEHSLRARVRTIEPAGFTKISALGVEEQRVNVVVDPIVEDPAWSRLGDGFRVELHIVLWEEPSVLVVPTGALFREGEDWHVFVVIEKAARKRRVTIGRRNGLEAQVVSGLDEGETVILYPSELIADEARVDVR